MTISTGEERTTTRPSPSTADVPSGQPATDHWRNYVWSLVALDLLAMAIGGGSAVVARFGSLAAQTVSTTPVPYVLVAALMAPVWVATMALGGTYDRRHLGVGPEEYRRVLAAAFRFLAVVAIIGFVARLDVARGFVAIAIPVATIATLGGRFSTRHWLHLQRGKARFLKKLVVVGTGASVDQLSGRLMDVPFVGYAVLGACVPAGSSVHDTATGVPVVAFEDTDGLVETARQWGAEAVAVADADTFSPAALRELALTLEARKIDLLLAPAITDLAGPRILARPVAELPLLHIEVPELSGARRLVKEAFDRAAAAALLVLLLPVLLGIALTIRVSAGKPVLFKQVRVGRHGKRFTLWKFRSMAVDAEDRLEALLELNEHDGVLFKMREDPRVTTVGRHLRRWSLDELPQLWNVLRGEMSLVGPRPPLPQEVERFCDRAHRRLLVKPGITGIWQVNGRAALSWDEALRLDLYYVEHWSPSLDVTIIARTLMAVLRKKGAY